jgi:acetyltransferase-like isoleucine patch superfamily enzyme
MREIIDYLLNKLIGVKNRYKQKMVIGTRTHFLPSFSLTLKSKNNRIEIGKECLLGVQIVTESNDAYIKIGDRVYIGKSKIICRSGVEFENDILVAWGVTFYDHDSHSLDYKERQKDIQNYLSDFENQRGDLINSKNWDVVKSKPIKVRNNSWVGMNAVILKGVTIGEGAIVAACSVVTRDVPPFTVVAGNPARVVKQLNREL